MEVGDYYNNILCESFLDPETGRVRIRTIKCPALPNSLMVESLKKFRELNRYHLGTKFTTKNIKICKKPDGRIYARAEGQMLYPLA
jgi:hypothetical protein